VITIVEFKRVIKRFGSVLAVDDVSFQIEEGQFFSLLGPSGCGKTTILNHIAGFLEPTSGEIYIENKLADDPPHLRNVNTVFQNYALFPHMTVEKNIGFGLRMKKVKKSEVKRRVQGVLEMVSLTGFEDRRTFELSGGQQQRVALARALVNRPAVLLLDEPLGSLDLKLRKQMQIELSKLQKQVGITFIYVTHDQEEAMTMSDRIAVMNEGKIVQIGTPEEIYKKPTSRFVAGFIGSSNFLEGKCIESNQGVVTSIHNNDITIKSETDSKVSKKDTVWVAIRPENMRLHKKKPEDQDNCLTGAITKVSYMGTYTQYLVSLPQNEEVMVQSASTEEETHYQLNDNVFVSWSKAKGLILTA
jgi:spermidine/putrescine transport system ATP-binding protein